MPQLDTLLDWFTIKRRGQPLDAEVMGRLVDLVVETDLHGADAITLRFLDHERDLLQRTGFALGDALEVTHHNRDGASVLTVGEVVALEADGEAEGMSHTLVRGLDRSWRLMGERKTASFLNSTYSDIVRTLAARAGLAVGTVDATPVHAHVAQLDQTDWELITQFAREVGFVAYVSQGKLHFRKLPPASGGPGTGTTVTEPAARQLVFGGNLRRFRTRVSALEQVSTVEVHGWDPTTKKAVLGSASVERPGASIGRTPAQVASVGGARKTIAINRPYATQRQADTAAKGLAAQVGSAGAFFEGEAIDAPQLSAGVAVSVAQLGAPFDGKYTLTSVRHSWTPERGFATSFTCSGLLPATLLAATGGQRPAQRMPLVVTAIVTNIKDDKNLGRVKVKFPWLDETFESDWARVCQPGAGANRGTMIVPEVNDEVLVVFDHGDPAHPVIIGGLYNGVDKPHDVGGAPVDGGGKTHSRSVVSRSGQKLILHDKERKEGIDLVTGDGKQKLQMQAGDKKILLTQSSPAGEITISQDTGRGKIVITASGNVEIQSKTGNVSVKATNDLALEAVNVSVKAKGALNLEATGPATLKGAVVKIN